MRRTPEWSWAFPEKLPICDLGSFFAIVEGDKSARRALGQGRTTVPTVLTSHRPTIHATKETHTVTMILRRLLGVVLILAGLGALVVGGWFARALGTDGAATFSTTPPADMPVVIGPDTNARTDIPLTITATAESSVPVTISIASPSDSEALIGETRHSRVVGIEVREWALTSETRGTEDPVVPATADLWRSQTTTDGTASVESDLENAPETMIITTPQGSSLTDLTMTWTNPAWFYQALALVFGGLLAVLVGLALIVLRSRPTTEEVAR